MRTQLATFLGSERRMVWVAAVNRCDCCCGGAWGQLV